MNYLVQSKHLKGQTGFDLDTHKKIKAVYTSKLVMVGDDDDDASADDDDDNNNGYGDD